MIYDVNEDMRFYFNHIQFSTGLRTPFSISRWIELHFFTFWSLCTVSLTKECQTFLVMSRMYWYC